jgi:hypothetical protein
VAVGILSGWLGGGGVLTPLVLDRGSSPKVATASVRAMLQSGRICRRAAAAALVLLVGSVLATQALGQTPERPEVKLTASDGAANDGFGTRVALSGDTALVVGAGADRRGPGYVFVRTGTTWTEQVNLTASDRAVGNGGGTSVALSGDTALFGAWGDDSLAGAAYVFVRTGTTWTEQARLTASDRAPNALFGTRVALSGDTALVGAARALNTISSPSGVYPTGAAYVFVRTGTTWTEQARLTASDRALDARFGDSVALSGDTALVGARSALNTVPSGVRGTGAGYVFVRTGTTWTEQAKRTASDGVGSAAFGFSVALKGDTALVGVPGMPRDAGPYIDAGAGYVFVRTGTTWTEQAKRTASDRAAHDQFGTSVALSGDTALVGTRRLVAGAAYVLLTTGCLVDTDNNGNPDNDGDGLCDNWETDGIDVDDDGIIDLALYDENQDGIIEAEERADLNHKDLYVEIDWMAQHEPLAAALRRPGSHRGMRQPTGNQCHAQRFRFF